MLATELIKRLQEEIEKHKAVEEMMGPLEIHIDAFRYHKESSLFAYAGISRDIELTYSSDGSMCVLTHRETWNSAKL